AVGRARGKVVLGTSQVGPGGSTNVLGGEENLRQVGARVGDTQLPNDRYAVLRRMPYSVLGLKSLAIVTGEKVLGRSIKRSELGGETAWIDYAGPPGTIPAVSFWRVALGRFPPGTFRDKVAVAAALGTAAVFSTGAQLAFNHGLILAFVSPLTALTLSSIGALAMHYLVAAFERERVRDVFSRFVPEGVVDQVLARTDADLRL